MYMYLFKKKYKNTWVLMYRSIKQFFFTQVHKTTERDSFDWITLEQY